MEVVPVDFSSHTFTEPVKMIKLPNDMRSKWDKSQALHDILNFIGILNEAARNKKLTDTCHISQYTVKVVEMLKKLEAWLEQFPPIDQPQRYGNKAFRDWFAMLNKSKEDLVKDIKEDLAEEAIKELSVYLSEGFGNSTRIDYGTGHELSFVAFLCCLYKIQVFKKEDALALVVVVFNRYIELMRKIQLLYRLEPAGSQGVWNLDDYQFIPFIFGSSQLIDNRQLSPTSFLDADVCQSMAPDFMFYACIVYINKVKKGPFAEHSNQLWNISGVASWSKINQGLIKMYRAEVLSKFPVIQHFLFGSLLKIDAITN